MASQLQNISTMPDATITDDFQQAFNLIENTQENVFLTGKAGTGKSTFLNYLRKNTLKNAVVLAPTGVSALNVNGQTIHSFFKFKPGLIDVSRIKKKSPWRIYTELELLIIDEISMVRADTFQAIETFLRYNGPHQGEPFGGVQICVIGDLFQLPPIVSYNEQQIFYSLYHTSFFFGCAAFEEADFKLVEFTEIFRQSNIEFIQFLEAIRQGNASTHLLDYINQRVVSPQEIAENDPIILTTTNKRADNINEIKLQQLTDNPKLYQGSFSGTFDHNDNRLPAPQQLILKKGAQVMFTKNDGQKRWVNGTVGTITTLAETSITVAIKDKYGMVEHKVEPTKWENLSYSFNPNSGTITQHINGHYTQYPLVLAWAITIHKSQGKTLDSVYIDLSTGAFATGQLYVALSRCTSFEKIVLKKAVNHSDIQCNAEVIEFMSEYQ